MSSTHVGLPLLAALAMLAGCAATEQSRSLEVPKVAAAAAPVYQVRPAKSISTQLADGTASNSWS
jgi:uncharacterized lipoprotein YajG